MKANEADHTPLRPAPQTPCGARVVLRRGLILRVGKAKVLYLKADAANRRTFQIVLDMAYILSSETESAPSGLVNYLRRSGHPPAWPCPPYE